MFPRVCSHMDVTVPGFFGGAGRDGHAKGTLGVFGGINIFAPL